MKSVHHGGQLRLSACLGFELYFASRLATPLEQLKAAASEVSEQVQTAASGASEAAIVLTAAIRKLKTKATQAEESLDTVVRLTTAQHSLFDTSAAQLGQLKKLGELLGEVQQALQATTKATAVNATSNAEVQGRVTAVVTAVEASQKAVVEAMGQVSSCLDAERDAASSLGRQVQSAEAATKELAQELRGNSAVAQQLTATSHTAASAALRSHAAPDVEWPVSAPADTQLQEATDRPQPGG